MSDKRYIGTEQGVSGQGIPGSGGFLRKTVGSGATTESGMTLYPLQPKANVSHVVVAAGMRVLTFLALAQGISCNAHGHSSWHIALAATLMGIGAALGWRW